MSRKKYSPLTAGCLLRLENMTKLRQDNGEGLEVYNGETIYTAQEVGYVLDVSTTTVANLVRASKLKALPLRRAIRFSERDLMEYIGAAYEAA